MLKRMLPTAWWSRTISIALTYIIAADFLPNLLLVLINCSGYLPYSDRPGPGWQTPHFPTGEELGFFVGFAGLLLPGTAILGAAFSAAGLILGFCGLPRWALRLFAALTAFLAAGLMMQGAGWYIAISALGVYVAAGCGLLWGIFVFPGLVPRMSYTLPLPARIALPVLMAVGGTYWLLKPFLPDPALTNAKIEVIKRDTAGAELSTIDLSYLGSSFAGEVKGQGKYLSIHRIEFTTDHRNQVRVLLMIDDDRPVSHSFVLPRSGVAIYRQSQGKWNQELAGARNSKLSLELKPDDPGITLRVQGPCCSSMSEQFGPTR
jgi:hypothetical protein